MLTDFNNDGDLPTMLGGDTLGQLLRLAFTQRNRLRDRYDECLLTSLYRTLDTIESLVANRDIVLK